MSITTTQATSSPPNTTRSTWVPTSGSTVRANPVGTLGVPSRVAPKATTGARTITGRARSTPRRRPRSGARPISTRTGRSDSGASSRRVRACRRGRDRGHPGDQAEQPEGKGLHVQRALNRTRLVRRAERGHLDPGRGTGGRVEVVETVGAVGEAGHDLHHEQRDRVPVGVVERRVEKHVGAAGARPEVEGAAGDADDRGRPRGSLSSKPAFRTTRWPTSRSPASANASLTTTSSVASVRARRPSMTTGR